jgi:hypothetical protein
VARLRGGSSFTTFAAIRRAKSPHIPRLLFRVLRHYSFPERQKEESMAWTIPVLIEICIGLEINGYMPADGYLPPEF